MHQDLGQNTYSRGRMEAGVKIVEILTFRRANRAQVKALEKDTFLVEPCVGVCVIMFMNAPVHGRVRLSGSIGSYIAPG